MQAIWLCCTGAREAAFRNIKSIAECLADELINAAKDEDEQNVTALLGWRLEPAAGRRAGFLIVQLAQLLQKNDLESDESIII